MNKQQLIFRLRILLGITIFGYMMKDTPCIQNLMKRGERFEPELQSELENHFFSYPYKLLFGLWSLFRVELKLLEGLSPLILIFMNLWYYTDHVLEFFIHWGRSYPTRTIIGWNIFIADPSIQEKYRLFIPTEFTFEFPELFQDNKSLYRRVLQDILNLPRNQFIVEFSDTNLKEECYRRLKNKVSQAVHTSVFAKFAHSMKNSNQTLVESPLMLLVYERDDNNYASNLTEALRVWLIFPEELRMLQEFQGLSDAELKVVIKVEQDNWIPRIRNLIRWSFLQFPPALNNNNNNPLRELPAKDIFLPLLSM